jgi:hypothetical protein
VGEDSINLDIDISERYLFREAAEIIVNARFSIFTAKKT